MLGDRTELESGHAGSPTSVPLIQVRLDGGHEQAFLNIKLPPENVKLIRFLLFKNPESDEIVRYRWTRMPFVLNCSPFIFRAVLKKHLANVEFYIGIQLNNIPLLLNQGSCEVEPSLPVGMRFSLNPDTVVRDTSSWQDLKIIALFIIIQIVPFTY